MLDAGVVVVEVAAVVEGEADDVVAVVVLEELNEDELGELVDRDVEVGVEAAADVVEDRAVEEEDEDGADGEAEELVERLVGELAGGDDEELDTTEDAVGVRESDCADVVVAADGKLDARLVLLGGVTDELEAVGPHIWSVAAGYCAQIKRAPSVPGVQTVPVIPPSRKQFAARP